MSRALVAVLALMTAAGPLAIDMYLPAFPEMADDLGTTATGVQLTLTTFLLGLGLGQLVIGPLSDAVGRRTPLLVGSAACLLASVACAVAPNVELLAGARFLQGLAGAAGVVLARAMVSDTEHGAAAARLMGVLTVMSVIAPVVGPLLGGSILALADWRMVFWVQAAMVALMLVGAAVFARETLPAGERTTGGFAATTRAAREVLANRNYLGYALTFCFSFAALFAYIAASPFVIQTILGLVGDVVHPGLQPQRRRDHRGQRGRRRARGQGLLPGDDHRRSRRSPAWPASACSCSPSTACRRCRRWCSSPSSRARSA